MKNVYVFQIKGRELNCSAYRNQRKKNVDNLNNERRKTSLHFRSKKKVYMKAKIDELDTNHKIKTVTDLYRDISDFKKGYQFRTNLVRDEKGNLVADFWLSGGTISLSCSMYLGSSFISIQPSRPVRQEPEPGYGNDMALGTLHPRQVLGGCLPLLSPAFRRSHFRRHVPLRPQRRERS